MHNENMEVLKDMPLAQFTTFKIGGAARYFTEVQNLREIREAIKFSRERSLPCHVIAGGSNLLVPDEGLDAHVIRIISSTYNIKESAIEAEAGCDLFTLIRISAGAGLSGWEKLAGIPGTLGGAIRGNAGAFNTEIKDVLLELNALNIETNELRRFLKSECDFSYRHSFFKQHPEWIIISAKLSLVLGDRHASEIIIMQTIAERERRHLQNIRAAGSFFMNPIAPREIVRLFEEEKKMQSRGDRVPAGWLIEKAGMKGARVGGAIASYQHADYIVNDGNATSEDVLHLSNIIKQKVRVHSGVTLLEEVMIL